MGVFNQRFENLFPRAGALGYVVCFFPLPFVPVYLCASVGPRGATCHSACPIIHHSESGPLGLSVHECEAAGSASGQTTCPDCPTLRPRAHLCPSYQSGRMFLFYLIDVELPSVQFSVSSGCARRHSVSTYAAILVLPFTSSIQHIIGSPSHSNQTRKGNKRHPNWKEGSKNVIACT